MRANGVHTISWNVFDDEDRGEGWGTRYFNVVNTAASGATAVEDVIDESVAREGVRVRHGLNLDRRPEPIAQEADGGYSVTMEEVGHIQLHLGAASGNMLLQGEPQPLPTGSTLKGGVFYWQPGPGFLRISTTPRWSPCASAWPRFARSTPTLETLRPPRTLTKRWPSCTTP